MLWLYLLMVLLGVVLTAMLSWRRSRHAVTAIIGTLLAVFAIITGFSIGIFVAPIALVVLGVAAFGLVSRERGT